MREPNRSLDPPDSFVYTGPMSTAGRDINRFALSLKNPANRATFLRDGHAHLVDQIVDAEREPHRAVEHRGVPRAEAELGALTQGERAGGTERERRHERSVTPPTDTFGDAQTARRSSSSSEGPPATSRTGMPQSCW